MAILRWGSSREMIFLHARMGKMFDEAHAVLNADARLGSLWVPPCDIYETPKDFILKAETPGVELDDIVLEINDNVVTFAGERKRHKGAAARNYHRVERSGGKFVRSFTLPVSVDEENISASLKDGVLTVTLPKKEMKKPSTVMKIKIK